MSDLSTVKARRCQRLIGTGTGTEYDGTVCLCHTLAKVKSNEIWSKSKRETQQFSSQSSFFFVDDSYHPVTGKTAARGTTFWCPWNDEI